MGLDMYLTAERYLGGYSDTANRDIALEALGGNHPPVTSDTSVTVTLNVAYWRKANQIHNWIVENVQGGEDDCKKHYVPLESLKELLSLCEKMLKSKSASEAEEELPTASGFFFGSTDYDDDYWRDLEDTVNQLRPLIDWIEADEKRSLHWDFYYQASW
jgi:hypothetical protein